MKDEFHPLLIAAVRRETADAVSLAVTVPDGLRQSFAYRPGQHLVIRAKLGGQEVRRTYSISSGPEDKELWITVKRVDGGLFSNHVHADLAPGATLESMAPAGRFVAPIDKGGENTGGDGHTYLAIAAGSGITPVMALIRHVLARETNSRFALIYGNRSLDSIIFREALDDLKDRYLGRLSIMHVLSRDADADVPLLSGRIDGDRITRLLPAIARPDDIDHAYLCGPGSLIKDARDTLLALGVPRERIHFEYFRAGPQSEQQSAPLLTPPRPASETGFAKTSAGKSDVGAEVVATIDGKRYTFRVPPDGLVVDAALAAGIRVPYSCKGGMCCTCRAKLVEGKVIMLRNFSLEPWEIEADFVLTCQAQPTTSRIVIDYDQV